VVSSNGKWNVILVQQDDRALLGGTFSGTYNGTPIQRKDKITIDGIIYDTILKVNLNSSFIQYLLNSDNKVRWSAEILTSVLGSKASGCCEFNKL
jgi:hypothetical protein